MRSYLLIRLYGAMASWGGVAVGEARPSADRPTKSALMGLLAAAMGLRRSEEEALLALHRGYGLAVRVDAAGELLRDYHTTQVPSEQRKVVYATRREELLAEKKKLNTILSQRDYRLDACYSVALWCRESAPYALSVLQEALKEPKFSLYLGRKACPLALPLEAQQIESESLKAAFEAVQWQGDEFLAALPRTDAQHFWEDLDQQQAGMKADLQLTRHDELLSRRRWQFSTREEFHCLGGGE